MFLSSASEDDYVINHICNPFLSFQNSSHLLLEIFRCRDNAKWKVAEAVSTKWGYKSCELLRVREQFHLMETYSCVQL